MHAFITGINGFIGSNLARYLLHKKCQVSGSVRETSDLQFIQNLPITLCTGNLFDRAFWNTCFRNVDIVFHAAGFVSDWGDKRDFLDINFEATKHIARCAFEADVKRFVFVSTTAVYGFSGYRNANEEFLRPSKNIDYAIAKMRAEDWLVNFADQTGLPVTIIQPSNVFGPFDRIFFLNFAPLLEKRVIPLIDQGRALTCPVYVENLADALWLAASHPEAAGEKFIISDGLNISWRQFIEAICAAMGVKPKYVSLNFEIAFGLATVMEWFYRLFRIKTAPPITRYRICNYGRDYHFSIEKARRILGYQPKIGLRDAIRKTVQWYTDYSNRLK